MIYDIRWRIATPYILLICATLFVVSLYVSGYLRTIVRDSQETALIAEARFTAEDLLPYLTQASKPTDLDQLARKWAELLNKRVTIIAVDGKVIGESQVDSETMQNHLDRPEIEQALLKGMGISSRYSSTLKKDMLYVAVPVKDTRGIIGFLRLAVPVQVLESEINHLQRILLGLTLLMAAMVVILATWIAGRTTRPIRELTQTVTQMAAGDLSHPIQPTSHDEVGQLTRAFMEMSERLSGQIYDLESERTKMAAVLSEMTDGVLIVDQHGRVQLSNPTAESMFSVKGTEILGHALIDVVRNHQLVEMWQKCKESGEKQSASLEMIPGNLYLQVNAIPMGKSLPGNTFILIHNLTRLRYLETVRRDFISNISHELRTPLASLKAITETLQESAIDDPPAARRFLLRMETEVDSLSLMVSELLELSRIESGRVPLKLTAITPNEVIQSAVERLRLQAERANLTLTIDCPKILSPILADSLRLEQVLVNLLHNAIKFTPAQGKITIRAREQPEFILFSVEDTGIGIPIDDLERIFERFYKSDRSRSSGGTGLGLAISRHLVEAHGGKIWAESVEGKGSVFFLTIPWA